MVVKWSSTFLQSWVCLSFHLISVTCGQSNHRASIAYIFDELIGCLTELEDLSRQENSHDLLIVGCKLLFERVHLHVSTSL